MIISYKVSEGLQYDHRLLVTLLPDHLIKQFVPAVPEYLSHGLLHGLLLFILRILFIKLILLLSELSRSLLLSFLLLLSLLGLVLFFIFFGLGYLRGGRFTSFLVGLVLDWVRDGGRNEGPLLLLSSIVVTLFILELLTVLKETNTVALRKLANDKFKLLSKFNLNLRKNWLVIIALINTFDTQFLPPILVHFLGFLP